MLFVCRPYQLPAFRRRKGLIVQKITWQFDVYTKKKRKKKEKSSNKQINKARFKHVTPELFMGSREATKARQTPWPLYITSCPALIRSQVR